MKEKYHVLIWRQGNQIKLNEKVMKHKIIEYKMPNITNL